MKVYIAVECGFEHTTILDVFAKNEDAEQLAKEWNDKLKKEWRLRNADDEDMLERGPYDSAHVWTREVKGAESLLLINPWSLPLKPSPLTEEELEWVKEQQIIDAEPDEE